MEKIIESQEDALIDMHRRIDALEFKKIDSVDGTDCVVHIHESHSIDSRGIGSDYIIEIIAINEKLIVRNDMLMENNEKLKQDNIIFKKIMLSIVDVIRKILLSIIYSLSLYHDNTLRRMINVLKKRRNILYKNHLDSSM